VTSRLDARMSAEADAIDRSRALRERLAATALSVPRFAVANLGSGPGDSGPATVRRVVVVDGQVKSVDPARVIFEARINPETGACLVIQQPADGLDRETMPRFVEWLTGWYGEAGQ